MKDANTFAIVAPEYFEKRKGDRHAPWEPATAIKNEYLLIQFEPGIGHLPVTEIQPADVLAVLRKIEAKGAHETARRALQMAGSVFRYAVATARLTSVPPREPNNRMPLQTAIPVEVTRLPA